MRLEAMAAITTWVFVGLGAITGAYALIGLALGKRTLSADRRATCRDLSQSVLLIVSGVLALTGVRAKGAVHQAVFAIFLASFAVWLGALALGVRPYLERRAERRNAPVPQPRHRRA